MSVQHLPATAATHVLAQPVDAYVMTAGRLWSVVGIVLGLAGVVIGALAARSATRPLTRRRGAIVALAAGLAGTVIGALVVAAAEGGPGTGYGIVGGWVCLVVGPVAMILGGLVLARSRRTA
ncbi:DUF6223 family protein [Nonomuraea wenchangensis]|uniref:Uncharacterized protein n=1 Tax=Nonomuraea wenchangensis TaxID=568860 RepID=A0A1I0LWL9_9ACTN|nr:DUF6223 family protein [Nonomuraea wenchangensis]SEU47943.1 hypothetical protein SAMN05421811_13321 [Nonomuraea wenchangensis]